MTQFRLGIRLLVIAGFLLIPAGLFAYLTDGLAEQHEKSQRQLHDRIAETERLLQLQQGNVERLQRQIESIGQQKVTPRPEMPAFAPQGRIPGSLRAERRLALMETLIRWVRKAGDAPEMAHVASGLVVVWGPGGQLVAPRTLADPWLDPERAQRRDDVLRQGGRAAVLYRVWNSGVSVLDATGALNRTTARLFDEPMERESFGKNLILLSGAEFPGESVDPGGPVPSGETVIAYRWPEAVNHGLPAQTRPLNQSMRFGDPSPEFAHAFLFDSGGQLRGFVDDRGKHHGLPSRMR
ncbi:MAG: hypothetical protein CMH55_10320 [Myxococcales bacterium]|nr:hypothetical protein [Myxococcales bacterium]